VNNNTVTICNNHVFSSKNFTVKRGIKSKVLNQVNLSNSLVRNIKFYNRCLSESRINLLCKLTKPTENAILDVHKAFYEELKTKRFYDVICDGCNNSVNAGLRFQCTYGCDYDLCYSCFSNGNNPNIGPHVSTHTWFRIFHKDSQQEHYYIQIPQLAASYSELIPYQLLSTLPITILLSAIKKI